VRVNGDTKYLTETLVSEIREVSKVIAEDRLAVKKSQKDSENEGTGKAEEEKGEDTGTA
jgi:hypothetical protein